jgi:hypothetical protein
MMLLMSSAGEFCPRSTLCIPQKNSITNRKVERVLFMSSESGVL